MTDRELLELAAKAAGIEITPHPNAKIARNLVFTAGGKNWNPLTDDGDALRLAVKLCMSVDIGGGGLVFAFCGEPECTEATEEMHPDPLAATRRAIVRAAAETARLRGHLPPPA